MRHLALVVIFFAVATTLAADDATKTRGVDRTPSIADVERHVVKTFPTVAKNQSRPLRVGTQEQDLDVEGGFGYTPGGCNCKRNCRNNKTQCKFIADVAQGCRYIANLSCDDCLSCVP